MEKNLLYLPCRHHIFEIVLRSVFDEKISKSVGCDVPIFKRFQKDWKNIDKTKFKSGIENKKVYEILEPYITHIVSFAQLKLTENQPRDDYRELLELTLFFLGHGVKSNKSFRLPGAFHHPRWMAKAIYCLKIYLFRYEFKLTKAEEEGLCDISIFLVFVYIEAWFNATLASNAPYHDLSFIKKLYNYKTIDESISRVSFNKFKNHLWYLCLESVALAFFDINISVEIKKKILINSSYCSQKI